MNQEPLTPESLGSIMEDLMQKYESEPQQLVMSLDTKTHLTALMKGPGFRNNSKRRRYLRQKEKDARKRKLTGDAFGMGLSRYITGES